MTLPRPLVLGAAILGGLVVLAVVGLLGFLEMLGHAWQPKPSSAAPDPCPAAPCICHSDCRAGGCLAGCPGVKHDEPLPDRLHNYGGPVDLPKAVERIRAEGYSGKAPAPQ